jgi:hypothetical protein
MRAPKRVAGIAAAVAAVLALGSGCSSGGGGSAGGAQGVAGDLPARGAPSGSVVGGAAGSAAEPAEKVPGSAARSTGGSSTIVRGAVVGARSIVYTADLSVRVRDVGAAVDRATGLATTAGGFLFGEQTDGPRDADVTLKVPAARFTDVLTSLGRLGRRLSTSESASDVTQNVVDLRSRVASARASVARIRALLGRATKIGEIIEIEGELTQREADLESLEGQLGVLTDQVALSTIDLHLTARPAAATAPPAPRHTGFVGGLQRGWHAFVATMAGIGTALGAALPFAILVAAVAAVALWVRRTVRSRRPTPTES